MSDRVVLDSSSILAWIFGEPGGDRAATLMPDAVVCAVNHGEVVGKLVERLSDPADIHRHLTRLPYAIAPFDAELAVAVGLLRPATRAFGLSLGDRACLALARREGLRVVTADQNWSKLGIGVAIELIR